MSIEPPEHPFLTHSSDHRRTCASPPTFAKLNHVDDFGNMVEKLVKDEAAYLFRAGLPFRARAGDSVL